MMNKMHEAIDRIRILECPTGDLEKRVKGILQDYGVAYASNVNISRDGSQNAGGALAYRVEPGDGGQMFVVLAKSGDDDYVTKVVDVKYPFYS